MNKSTRTKTFYLSWLFAFVFLFIFSACSAPTSSAGSTATLQAPTVTTTQQATAQKTYFSSPVTYVALGASDAVGVGATQPGSQGYVPLLEARLPQGSHLINLGVSGIHLQQAIQEELPIALSSSPDLVTIWLVANDFVAGVPYADYMQSLDSLLKQLHSGTHARIVMGNLPDLTRLPRFSNQTATEKAQMLADIQKWNAQIAILTKQYGVILVDLFSHESDLTSHPEYVSGDGFHPSSAGYVQLANAFWAAINQ